MLIIGEVSCVFDPHIGGLQAGLGVRLDKTVLAMAMSNGYPMGAVVGSRKVMEPASRMCISSSYWSDNLGLAASLATMRELEGRDPARRFEDIGALLIDRLNQALSETGLPGACGGVFWNPLVRLDSADQSLRTVANIIFIQVMAPRHSLQHELQCHPGAH